MSRFRPPGCRFSSMSSWPWRRCRSHFQASARGRCGKGAAPVGAAFHVPDAGHGIAWGRPMWGTLLEWDARLLVLGLFFFLYLGYRRCGVRSKIHPCRQGRRRAGDRRHRQWPISFLAMWRLAHRRRRPADGPTIHITSCGRFSVRTGSWCCFRPFLLVRIDGIRTRLLSRSCHLHGNSVTSFAKGWLCAFHLALLCLTVW